MHRNRVQAVVLVLVLLVALVLPGSTGAQTGLDYRQPSGANWPVVGGDWGNTRYSTLDQITPANVANLKGAWMARLEGSGFDTKYNQQASPVVVDGVMYVPTGQQDIFALDARTGAKLWKYTSDVDPKSAGGWNNRGIAVAENSVYAIQKDLRIIALDQRTGERLWMAQMGEDVPAGVSAYITSPPVYHDGLLYVGMSGGDGGLRGRLHALDAKTGKEVWRFYTVPGPGEFGNDTWEGDSWQYGGAAIWTQPALDPELGVLYLNTGNAWPDYDGSVRGGDNLFTASIVALDAKTGQYRWHYQLVHHEIWDYDAPNPNVLFDTVINGQPRKVLAAASKQGWMFLLDRTNGRPLLGIDERPVAQEPRQKTAATQPFPLGEPFFPQCITDPVPGFVSGCYFDAFWDQGNVVTPSTAADWAPTSYSPQTGYLYVAAGREPQAFRVQSSRIENGKVVVERSGGKIPVIGSRRFGTLTAIDSRTNRVAWQKMMPYAISAGSGTLVTAGGVLFHGEPDGNMQAYDAQTGDLLWQFQTGFGADGAIVSYQLDGEQYVAIPTGGTSLALSARGDAVWAFKLRGTLSPLNPPPAPPKYVVAPSFGGAPAMTNSVEIGREVASGQNIANEYSFGPTEIQVSVGATVTFTNKGDIAHSATDNGATWDTGLLASGESALVTFDKPGVYTYHCDPHPWMLGQITVT
jgi:quinohemoprotein ethanol dehydrogenase